MCKSEKGGGFVSKQIGRYTLPEYSVLMSVYDRELPENLNESLESMLMQSYPPSDFVLVCDGKLTNELNIIVKSFENEFKKIFRIVRIEENVGTGKALNEGIKACKYDFIVRMDSDDISLPNRCLKQMLLFAVRPGLDIIGTYVDEFDDSTEMTVATKKVPVMNKEIKKYSKYRNPFNRQSVAFRKSFAEKIGGYSDLKLCEDYDFVVRMLYNGARGQNIPESLVRYRVDKSTADVRRSFRMTRGFIRVRWEIYKLGYTHFHQFLLPCIMQMVMFILPKRFTNWVYGRFLRG
jgi:glycosyltransferase involved in cell wall biosynthesis